MDQSTGTVDRICAAVAKRILDRESQPVIWPMPIMEPHWYLKKAYLLDLYNLLQAAEGTGMGRDRIAPLFRTPTRLARMFFYLVDFPLSDSGLSVDQRVWLAEKLVDLIAFFRREDVYCDTGRDLLWQSDEVEKAMESTPLARVVRGAKGEPWRRAMGKLNASLFMYEEFIHLGRHQYAHQYHGPYGLGDGRLLLVREHVDLKPVRVWQFTSDLPGETIRSLEIYQGVDIRLSCFNHIGSSSALPDHLRECCVTVGDPARPLTSAAEVVGLQEGIARTVERGLQATQSFSKTDWLRKSVEMAYLALTPLAKAVGQDLWVPQQTYDLVAADAASVHVQQMWQDAREISQGKRGEPRRALEEYLRGNFFAQ